ncbi:MAG: hypothetical protein QW304_07690 [Thermoproteota archaeon]
MNLRQLRFANDYFISIDNGKITVTNRRSMIDFFYKLTSELKKLGVDIEVEHFDPQGDDWP